MSGSDGSCTEGSRDVSGHNCRSGDARPSLQRAECAPMTVELVGAGVGRTGTVSLKIALEWLLGQPAYHMAEIFSRPDDVAIWRRAADGDLPEWSELFAGYGSVLDWPAAAFFAEIAAAFPECPGSPLDTSRSPGVVAQRQRHDLRDPAAAPRTGHGGVARDVGRGHVRPLTRTSTTRRWPLPPTSDTSKRYAAPFPPTDSSNGSRPTAGARCATPFNSRCRTSPFPT